LGALSGLLAKVGLDQDQTSTSFIPPSFLLPLRAFLLLLTLASNCCMVAIYSRALQASPTSAEASLVSTASNLLLTAAASSLFLGEPLSLAWWLGALLIVAGSSLFLGEPLSPAWWLGALLIVAGSYLVASDPVKEKEQ